MDNAKARLLRSATLPMRLAMDTVGGEVVYCPNCLGLIQTPHNLMPIQCNCGHDIIFRVKEPK